ncbi:MAG: HAMP domain-containing sensor histidine kinase [Polyangiaceae bacterium]
MAAVGHDLKNPLNAMVMATGVMKELTTDQAMLSLIDRVRSSGMRMARIIDDLFDLSRARVGSGIPVVRVATDALSIAQRALQEQDSTQRGRSILLDHSGNLEGNWDADRITQVMCNLLANALRHGDSAAPIMLSLLGKDDVVLIKVYNGGAIPPQILPHVFDPFRSAENKAKRQGLGLGLYIVDQIVLAHQGNVEVTSNEKEGTTFTVHLPRGSSA